MKPSILLPQVFVILSSFLIAQSSSAYLQYTYTNNALEWQSSFVNDMDYGQEINNDEDGQISFNYSFNIDENLLSDTAPTTFIIKNTNAYSDRSLGDPFHEFDLHPKVDGKVTINPDKSIRYWSFVVNLAITDLNENNYVNKLQDHDVKIISRGGRNTCNCDKFWEDMNLTTQRPHDTWIIAATVDNYYLSESDFNNWSVEQLSVAESNPLMLMAIGLMGFLVMRKKTLKKQHTPTYEVQHTDK